MLLHPRLNPFAEQCIIGEIGYNSTYGFYSNVVNQEHDNRENRQSQETVRYNTVDFIGNRQTGLAFDNCIAHQLANVVITLVGNNAFGIIIQCFLAGCNDFFNLSLLALTQAQSISNFLITLKQLYQQPALAHTVHLVACFAGNRSQSILNFAAEAHIFRCSTADSFNCFFGSLTGAFTLQCGGFHNLAAKLGSQFSGINLIAVLAHDINHVQSNSYRITHFHNLCSQVQVTLDVRTVNQIQHTVNIALQQIVTGNNLFQSVWGQGINTGQVGNNYIIVTFKAAFFFLYSYAGPVTNILVGTGQIIKHCCFAAVRVTNQGNLDLFHLFPPNYSTTMCSASPLRNVSS